MEPHPHQPAASHACTVCGRAFPSRTKLFLHLRTPPRGGGELTECNLAAEAAGLTLLPPEEDRRHVVFFHGYADNHHVPSGSAAAHLWEAAASLYSGAGVKTASLPPGACHTIPSGRAELVDMDVFALSLSHLPNLDMSGGAVEVALVLSRAEVAIAERLPPSVTLYGMTLAPTWFRADVHYAYTQTVKCRIHQYAVLYAV